MSASPTGISKGFQELVAERAAHGIEAPPFDVLIVGSGYGGSIAASELSALTEHGKPLSICVLERGNEYRPGAFPSRLAELPRHFRWHNAEASKPSGELTGLFDVRVGSDVCALVANGLGGGSLINAGVMESPRTSLFDSKWPASLRTDPDLWTYFATAKKLLGAASAAGENTIALSSEAVPAKFRDLEALVASADAAQFHPSFRAASITIAMRDGVNQSGVHRAACRFCGDCATGCNHSAKNSLDVNLCRGCSTRRRHLYGRHGFADRARVGLERLDSVGQLHGS